MFSQANTKDKELIISQFYEIFGYEKNVILSICENKNWQIDDCVENLVAYGENLITVPEKDTITSIESVAETKNNPNSYTEILKSDEKEKPNVAQNFSQIIKYNNLGAVPKDSNNVDQKVYESILNDSKIKSIVDHITSGHKIMIIMRGAPGSGKSHLARQLLKTCDMSPKYDYKSFICSTDDYFYNINDKYVYQSEKLSDAHEFNQRRVRKKAVEGWSPLIVDNTNIKIWEMLPYVQIAIQNGYLIEILESNTPWRHSVSKLALKNKHGVPKDKIKRCLMFYEPTTTDQLIQIMKTTQYTVSLPQFRRYPLIESLQVDKLSSDTEPIKEQFSEYTSINENLLNTFSWLLPTKSSEIPTLKQDIEKELPENITKNFFPKKNISGSWEKVDEKENELHCNDSHSWVIYNSDRQTSDLKMKENVGHFEIVNNTCNFWTDNTDDISNIVETDNTEKKNPSTSNIDRRHKENIFDNVIHSETLMNDNNEIFDEWQPYESESNKFWSIQKKEIEKKISLPKPQRNFIKIDTSPQENIFRILKENEGREEDITKEDKSNKINNSKEALQRHSIDCPNENESFILVRQICPDKNINGLWDLFEKCDGNAQWVLDILLKDDTSVESIKSPSEVSYFKCNCNVTVKSNSGSDIVSEIKLSEQHSKNNDCIIDSPKQKRMKDKSNIPDELMKVKHAIENKVIMDDSQRSEHFRKIRNSKRCLANNLSTSLKSFTNNVHKLDDDGSEDILESSNENEMVEIDLGKEFIVQLENIFGATQTPVTKGLKTNIFMPKTLGKQLYALWMESIYNQLEEEKQETIKKDEEFALLLQSSSHTSTNKESYKDILDMELAWSVYKTNPDQWKNEGHQNLASFLAHVKLCEMFPDIEKDTLLQILHAHGNSLSETVKALNNSIEENCSDIINEKKNNLLKLANEETEDKLEEESYSRENNSIKKLSPEESKKAALRDFEECRNLAAHHSQLKAECYEKAKEAIQKGNSAVAVYYSQISNLHKNKIDYYNHKAANCIMEVHDLTQNNPDFIDLHYLHTMEALECLDIFLDNHILKLRNLNRPYKHIFIITGRGLHSAKGVSTIKNKVKSRLKDRTLKWSEVNPGLLKVKVFSASKFSKNS